MIFCVYLNQNYKQCRFRCFCLLSKQLIYYLIIFQWVCIAIILNWDGDQWICFGHRIWILNIFVVSYFLILIVIKWNLSHFKRFERFYHLLPSWHFDNIQLSFAKNYKKIIFPFLIFCFGVLVESWCGSSSSRYCERLQWRKCQEILHILSMGKLVSLFIFFASLLLSRSPETH